MAAFDHAVIDGVETKAHIRDLPQEIRVRDFPDIFKLEFINQENQSADSSGPSLFLIGWCRFQTCRGLDERASVSSIGAVLLCFYVVEQPAETEP